MRVWFLTNGCGEDRAAALVASAVACREPGMEILAATLVTNGAAFEARGFRVPITGAEPPSGGFPFSSIGALIRDVPTIAACSRYVRALCRLAQPGDGVVAAGDTFLLGLAHRAFRRPAIHLALAKSVHGRAHSRIEHALLRRWASVVFTRDEATAAALRAHSVRAEFLGNPLVDRETSSALGETRLRASEPPGALVLLLPGSRLEAPANLVRLLDVVSHVSGAARYMCAWPDALPVADGFRAARERGWIERGDCVARGNLAVGLAAGRFDELLPCAGIVIGLAGTANEQAAALGKPVVTFVGAGAQTCAARMREQERLLGGAARFIDGGAEAVAEEVSALLNSPVERDRRGRLGTDRLGQPGGAVRVAERIATLLSVSSARTTSS